jgi:hypothetical protein
MSTDRKKGVGVRITPPNTRKPRSKDPHEEDGETLPESEDEPVEGNENGEDQSPIDMVTIRKDFRQMQS